MYNDTNPHSGVGLVRKEMASLDQLLFTFDLIKYIYKGYHGILGSQKNSLITQQSSRFWNKNMTSTWPARKSSSRYKKNHGSSLLGTLER